jgi:hypothetical protein
LKSPLSAKSEVSARAYELLLYEVVVEKVLPSGAVSLATTQYEWL